MPVVLRSQVFSLMLMLLIVLLALLPFFVGVLAFMLVCLCDNLSLSEEGNGWTDSLIEIFLVDFDPVDVPCLFADLDSFENLLFVDFKRREIIWGEHISRAMKTRQLHELADDFCCFQTRTKRHLDILTMLTNALWIKGIRACHRQKFFPRHVFWFSIVELDDPLLDRFFPGFTHRLIQN